MRSPYMGLLHLAIILALLSGCGGGGSPSLPPKTLSYTTNPAVYTRGAAIADNLPEITGGTPTSYAVNPALPAGLALDPATGVLRGTPTATAPAAAYAVVAGNDAGSATATLTITVLPPSLAKAAGDSQTALPGTAAGVAPEVRVLDSTGAPVANVAVTFAVTAGGGRVADGQALTGAAGTASCGAWTLGPGAGLNVLQAAVAGVPPVTFLAQAGQISADISIVMESPAPGATVDDPLTVAAKVTSTYQLSTVTASVNGTSVPLTYTPYGSVAAGTWGGTLTLAGQPRGLLGLVVTATDAYSGVTEAVVPVVFDRHPIVAVAAPLEVGVARPTLTLSATCSDDDPAGPVSLTASVNGVVLATGRTSISQQVDLSAWEGQTIGILFTGTDSIGQQTMVGRDIYVESSPRLATLAEVSGPVLDALGTRILFLDPTGPLVSLKILDTSTGITEVIETSADLFGPQGCSGYLTPAGALYIHGINGGTSLSPWLFEWRAGARTTLGTLAVSDSLSVAGNWAIYTIPDLWLRDIGAGVATLVSSNAGNAGNGVAPDGDVAYMSLDHQVHRWSGGTDTAITSGPVHSFAPRTDGRNIAYLKGDYQQGVQIAMFDGSVETILTPPSTNYPSPGPWYGVAGGFVAYLSEDATKVGQVWRHGPGGAEQLTFYGTFSFIDAIGTDGTILLSHSPKRYQATPGMALQEVGSSLGRVIYRDGRFLVVLGRDVLALVP